MRIETMGNKIEIGALISGGGSNLQAIMDACEDGRIEGRVSFVGADNPHAKGLERAKKRSIPVFTVDYDRIIADGKKRPNGIDVPSDFDFREIFSKQTIFSLDASPGKVRLFLETRAAAESRLLAHMAEYPFDLLVLAGFMRILTPYFIDRVNADPEKPRIMNIHPALLPSFPAPTATEIRFGTDARSADAPSISSITARTRARSSGRGLSIFLWETL